jgi:hypothetical protein
MSKSVVRNQMKKMREKEKEEDSKKEELFNYRILVFIRLVFIVLLSTLVLASGSVSKLSFIIIANKINASNRRRNNLTVKLFV